MITCYVCGKEVKGKMTAHYVDKHPETLVPTVKLTKTEADILGVGNDKPKARRKYT